MNNNSAICAVSSSKNKFRMLIECGPLVKAAQSGGSERGDGPGIPDRGHPKNEITKITFYKNAVTRCFFVLYGY